MRGSVVSVSDGFATVQVPGVGQLCVERDKPVEAGNTVTITVRPEKIRIGRERPASLDPNSNILQGTVDEVIYTGFQSKYFVATAEGTILRVFKQHVSYSDEGPALRWREGAHLWWDAQDGYLVEVLQ